MTVKDYFFLDVSLLFKNKPKMCQDSSIEIEVLCYLFIFRFFNCFYFKAGAIGFLILGKGETEEWAKKKSVKVLDGEDIPLNQR